ncbi:MAG: hypothetical protein V3S69_00225 [Dehalococcoidales bacterium]
MDSNFKNKEAYRDQCQEWVARLHMCTITGKPGSVEEVLKQIASKLHVREGYELYGEDDELL